MVDTDRRPTAQEIEELIDLVRRDPSSPAFIDLGEAYLALGRPKDAIGVGTVGLEAAPDSLEGRVMVARAHASLHQWKEAQGELLRVVKVDKSNRVGFALLGEVLLRRSDFERAVPVLQHAQNLDPTSPAILAMLKRARSGQTLDAPAPIPTPVPPRGETENEAPISRAPAKPAPPRPAPAPAPPPKAPRSAPMAAQPAPIAPAPQPSGLAPDQSRGHKPTAPPPMNIDGVRPRVISGAKPQNAAAASLRQSAAVGESYLNELLTGGLLDVAGVRVPDAEYDLRPDRRWGRSTRRSFIFLFVVLVLGLGGGTTWYFWSEKQKADAIAKLQKEATQAIGNGDFAAFELSLGKLQEALKIDPANVVSIADFAQSGGLESLLYGLDPGLATEAIKGTAGALKPGDPGWREVVIGKAAVELSKLGTNENAATALADQRTKLDEFLGKNAGDKWAQWLKARAMLAAGERTAANAALRDAAEGDAGLTVAMVDQADLMIDDGHLDDGLALYEKVLAKAKDHPLALVGRALARAESSVQADQAIDDLNVKLDKKLGPRVASYRFLALALAQAGIEDYQHSAEALSKAVANKPPVEPRFWSRVAWIYLTRGEFAFAATARNKVAYYGKVHIDPKNPTAPGKSDAEPDPSVTLVDAGLYLARGLPDRALDTASKIDGVRQRLLRAYAEIDLNKPKDAMADADEILKKAPENLEAQILREEARLIASTDKERAAAADALEKLARKAKSKLGRHALGIAYWIVGDNKSAQPQLEQALAEISDESPNPLAYRTRTALADILLAANDVDGAQKQIDESLKANSGYLPARALDAKILLKKNDPDAAFDMIDAVSKEEAAFTPAAKLTRAEALVARKTATDADKKQAQTYLEEIKDKVTPPCEVGRVAALIDPKLPATLAVPDHCEGAPAPGAPPGAPAGEHHHHHH